MTGYATHAPGTMAKAQMTGGSRRQRGIILRWTGVRATYEVDKAMGDAGSRSTRVLGSRPQGRRSLKEVLANADLDIAVHHGRGICFHLELVRP